MRIVRIKKHFFSKIERTYLVHIFDLSNFRDTRYVKKCIANANVTKNWNRKLWDEDDKCFGNKINKYINFIIKDVHMYVVYENRGAPKNRQSFNKMLESF